MTVTVRKLGGSVAVVIPKGIARGMELTEGTTLQISGDAGEIVMRRTGHRPRRSLKQLVAKIKTSSYRRRAEEFANDRPVGREEW